MLFLHENGTVKEHQKISSTEGNFTGPLDDYDWFSVSPTPVGDLNEDGVIDLAVGAADDDDGGVQRGAVWMLCLNTDGTVQSEWKISSTEGNFTGPLDSWDRFANAAALGDFNGDGYPDLAVGASGDGDGGFRRGAVWVLRLSDDVLAAVDDPQMENSVLGSHLVASLPNPSNPRTTIHYDLAQPGDASIRIYDIAGRLVRDFDLSEQPAGVSSVEWDGKDDRGRVVAHGNYLVRLVTPESQDAMQLTLIK